ncbi:hypothetical protein [Micromonospora sp. WMMD712]|uniref:MmyB family transcriptional regulator n=1 Tax=Micromonospora sp. WMMD712 TaxID=3016096 RepID=UPI00249A0E2D|nr:hypothetical protein [Micromonospora sp. WMMD712]WFE56890.1 hypothetical protein O7633_08380 [Micromonospora sp. WMMD712]
MLIGQLGALPAYVLGRTQDVLAVNALGAALWQGFARHDNLLRMLFLDPEADGFHRDPERARHRSIGRLELRHQVFRDRASAGQQLVVRHPEPGSASADALVLLSAMLTRPPDQGRQRRSHS